MPWVDAYAARAIKAGFTAFGFTIDSAHFSRRERDIIHAGNNSGLSDAPDPYLSTMNWDKIKRFKDKHKDVAVAVKGVTHGEDAELALKAGVVGDLGLDPWRPAMRSRARRLSGAARGRAGGQRQGDDHHG